MSKRPAPSKVHPIVARIVAEAERRNLSTYAVARAAGCSVSTAQRVFAGAASPSLDVLDAIAKALGLRIVVKGGKAGAGDP